jgi:hypothetical protein
MGWLTSVRLIPTWWTSWGCRENRPPTTPRPVVAKIFDELEPPGYNDLKFD